MLRRVRLSIASIPSLPVSLLPVSLLAVSLLSLACSDPPPPPAPAPTPTPRPSPAPDWLEQHPREGDIGAAEPLETEHYRIVSDLSAPFVARYAQRVERLHAALRLRLGAWPADTPRPQLWIYATAEGYADEALTPDSLAFYSFKDRRLVLKHGRYAGRTSLEGLAEQLASLYLHHRVGERIHALGWLAAGVGSYLSTFREQEGALVLGPPPASLRGRLAGRAAELLPLIEEPWTPEARADAWSLVHCLFEHGEPAVRQRGERWLEALLAFDGPRAPVDQLAALGAEREQRELERDWAKWREGLAP